MWERYRWREIAHPLKIICGASKISYWRCKSITRCIFQADGIRDELRASQPCSCSSSVRSRVYQRPSGGRWRLSMKMDTFSRWCGCSWPFGSWRQLMNGKAMATENSRQMVITKICFTSYLSFFFIFLPSMWAYLYNAINTLLINLSIPCHSMVTGCGNLREKVS